MIKINEKSLLLNLAEDMPLFRIIDFLIGNKGIDFSKKDIIGGAKISRDSLFNCWGELENYGIVKVKRSFGKTRLYTLNNENPITQKILELERALISKAMDKLYKKKELIVGN